MKGFSRNAARTKTLTKRYQRRATSFTFFMKNTLLSLGFMGASIFHAIIDADPEKGWMSTQRKDCPKNIFIYMCVCVYIYIYSVCVWGW